MFIKPSDLLLLCWSPLEGLAWTISWLTSFLSQLEACPVMSHDLAVDKLLPSSNGSANCSQQQKPPFFKSVLVERFNSLTKTIHWRLASATDSICSCGLITFVPILPSSSTLCCHVAQDVVPFSSQSRYSTRFRMGKQDKNQSSRGKTTLRYAKNPTIN